jgi:hypothetical protein
MTTFNLTAFQSRIQKAGDRAQKAAQKSAETDQRVQKRLEKLDKAKAKAKKESDATLAEALKDKVGAEATMAECDREKAAANAQKLAAYVRQLAREAELKQERAEQKAAKKGPAVWGVRTADGTTTPITCKDGAFGKLVGRSRSVSMSVETFAFMLGDECVDLVNDCEGVIVCNELTYSVTVGDNVTLTKV